MFKKKAYERKLVETLNETKQLNELLKSYIHVAIDKQSINNIERQKENEKLFDALEEIKNSITHINKALINNGIISNEIGNHEKTIQHFENEIKFLENEVDELLPLQTLKNELEVPENAIDLLKEIHDEHAELLKELELISEIPPIEIDDERVELLKY